MNQDTYAIALKNALTEIKKMCPDVSRSFIFTNDGMKVAGDSETAEETIEKTVHSFQSIVEKGDIIGDLKALIIEGEKGNVHISYIKDAYLALVTSKNADATFLRAITHVIVPTVLKLLESITSTPLQPAPTPIQFAPTPPKFAPTPLQLAPAPLQSAPSKQLLTLKQLIVDTLSGFFVGDSVQVDLELLKQWSELLNQKSIDEVEIEAFGGNTIQCRVKEINDAKLREKGIIRIPEKICKMLEVKKGEMVKVKPAETNEEIEER